MTLQEKFDEYGEKCLKEGEKRNTYKTIDNLLSKGMSIDFIHDVTELSKEEIIAYVNKKNLSNK